MVVKLKQLEKANNYKISKDYKVFIQYCFMTKPKH